ncbi:MAG: hypothetical protein EXR72_25565 [Myxococcales bacterium]|nr:hypothetical protein [Myxococcales bacterium]
MPSLRTGRLRLRLRLRDEQEPARGPPPLSSTPCRGGLDGGGGPRLRRFAMPWSLAFPFPFPSRARWIRRRDTAPLVVYPEATGRYVEALDARRGTLVEEVEEDIAPYRGLSMEERGERLAAVCRSAWAILRARPDFARVAAYRDPPAADFAERWRTLMERRRRTIDGSG